MDGRRRPGAPSWRAPAPLAVAGRAGHAAVHPFAHGERPRGRLIHLAAYLAIVLTVSLPVGRRRRSLVPDRGAAGAPRGAGAVLAVSYAAGTLAFPTPPSSTHPARWPRCWVAAFALAWRGASASRVRARAPDPGRPVPRIRDRLRVPGCALAAVIGSTRPRDPALDATGMDRRGRGPAARGSPPITTPRSGTLHRRLRRLRRPESPRRPLARITPPQPRILMKVLFSTERVSSTHSLAGPGRAGAGRTRPAPETRLEVVWPVWPPSASVLLFNSSLTRTPDDWRGGAGVGTRVLIPWIPVLRHRPVEW